MKYSNEYFVCPFFGNSEVGLLMNRGSYILRIDSRIQKRIAIPPRRTKIQKLVTLLNQ